MHAIYKELLKLMNVVDLLPLSYSKDGIRTQNGNYNSKQIPAKSISIFYKQILSEEGKEIDKIYGIRMNYCKVLQFKVRNRLEK